MRDPGRTGAPTGPHRFCETQTRFEAIYASYYHPILRYALRRTSTREDAYDVVAETFLTAWRRRDQAPDGAAVQLWLYGIARKVTANHLRGVRRRHRLQARLSAGVSSDAAGLYERPSEGSGTDAREAIAAAFAELGPDDQEILMLVAAEGLSPSQAAIVLGCRGATARVKLHRARARLTRALATRGIRLDAT